jgi:hypothetical protein
LFSRNTQVAVGAHDMRNVINMNHFKKYKHIWIYKRDDERDRQIILYRTFEI